MKLLAAVALAISTFGPASAATLTFDSFVSTNGSDKLSPVVTVTENGSLFDVSVTQTGTLTGSLNLLAFDLTQPVPGFVVTSVTNDSTTLTRQLSGCSLNGNNGLGTFCTGDSVPLGGNDNNLNGNSLPSFTADAVLAFQNKDDIAVNGSTLMFTLDFGNSSVALADFLQVGLRFQSATNNARSDKLIGTPSPLSPVPLPAPALLLAGALGGFGLLRRRTAKAA